VNRKVPRTLGVGEEKSSRWLNGRLRRKRFRNGLLSQALNPASFNLCRNSMDDWLTSPRVRVTAQRLKHPHHPELKIGRHDREEGAPARALNRAAGPWEQGDPARCAAPAERHGA
jgi:hypothetical protein